MVNFAYDQKLKFDTELALAGSALTGSAVLIGTLKNEPVVLLVKNQTNQSVFFSDNNGTTNGTHMAAGEEFIIDCRANAANAINMGFPIGTSFYATGSTGTGNFYVGSLYAY
jgi:hypothetical protein